LEATVKLGIKQLGPRLTDEQAAVLKELAQKAGVSLSKYIAQVLERHVKEMETHVDFAATFDAFDERIAKMFERSGRLMDQRFDDLTKQIERALGTPQAAVKDQPGAIERGPNGEYWNGSFWQKPKPN
jgi:predicted DNA-binding protein